MVISDSALDAFRKCLALFIDPAMPAAVSIRRAPAGGSVQYKMSSGFRGIVLAYGGILNDTGMYMLAYGTGYAVNKAIAAASNISITHSGATYTINNNSQYDVPICVLTMIGTAEEV